MKVEKEYQKEKDKKKRTHKAAPVSTCPKVHESSGLIASHALSVLSHNENCAWIVDSGATCHV